MRLTSAYGPNDAASMTHRVQSDGRSPWGNHSRSSRPWRRTPPSQVVLLIDEMTSHVTTTLGGSRRQISDGYTVRAGTEPPSFSPAPTPSARGMTHDTDK